MKYRNFCSCIMTRTHSMVQLNELKWVFRRSWNTLQSYCLLLCRKKDTIQWRVNNFYIASPSSENDRCFMVVVIVRYQEEVFHTGGGDALEQVGQGGCGCPIPGLVVGDPAHSRGVETQRSLCSLSAQAILWLYNSYKLFSMLYLLLKAPTSPYISILLLCTLV